MNVARLPRPEVKGTGRVLYRCADCGATGVPELFVIRDGRSYHRSKESTCGR